MNHFTRAGQRFMGRLSSKRLLVGTGVVVVLVTIALASIMYTTAEVLREPFQSFVNVPNVQRSILRCLGLGLAGSLTLLVALVPAIFVVYYLEELRKPTEM